MAERVFRRSSIGAAGAAEVAAAVFSEPAAGRRGEPIRRRSGVPFPAPPVACHRRPSQPREPSHPWMRPG